MPYLAPEGVIILLQNGMNERAAARYAGGDRVIGCVVHMSGGCPGPGEVFGICGKAWSAFTLGEIDGPSRERTRAAAELLSAIGKTHVSEDIWSVKWSKLILNVASNAIAGLSGLGTAQLWSDPRTLPLLVHLGGEAVEVAEAGGYRIADIQASGAPAPITPEMLKAAHRGDAAAYARVGELFSAAAATRVGKSENKSSLLQDVLKRRHAEAVYLNGHVIDEGRRLNVPTPVNIAVVAAMRDLEESNGDPAPERLEPLRAGL
jgi:2-dehydropantoate 2-reductase